MGREDVGPSLLAQALEAPDDPVPHLVYADWLEQQGDPFAQLIRQQHELGTAAKGKRAPIASQIAALIKKHRKTWVDPIDEWVNSVDDEPYFERGMLRRLYGAAGKYAQKATQSRLLPLCRKFGLRATMLRGKAAKIGGCETLAFTNELFWWDCGLDDAGMAGLAESPHVARLLALTLEKVRCTNAGIRALAKSKQLRRLRHLGLRAPVHMGNFNETSVIAAVAHLPIDSLDLTGLNRVDARALGDDPAVAKLARLAIHTDLAKIAGAKQLANLRELRVESLTTKPADIEALLANATFSRLERFSLYAYTTRFPAALVERLGARFETDWPHR